MNKKIRKAIFFSVILLFGVPLHGACAADNKIIVQPVANSSGDQNLDPLSRGFSDLLVTYLSSYGDLEILYREDLHKIWQELAQTTSGLQETDALRLGKLIQANKLIKGGFVKIDGAFQANVHVYDIETTQLLYSFKDTGAIEDVDMLASNIARAIAEKLLHVEHVIQAQPVDDQPKVNAHFMKGLGYYYSGLHDHAVTEFMQVLDSAPARADARMWLGKSYYESGEYGHAGIEFERFLEDFPEHKDADRVRTALGMLPRE